MSFGIALSGGGTRGAAHVGVLSALEEYGMLPRAVSGTSAGSIAAGLYGIGMSAGQMREVVAYLSKNGSRLMDADYAGLLRAIYQLISNKPLTFSGLIKGNRLEAYFHGLTQGKSIRDAALRTVITAVDLKSGQTIAYTNTLRGTAPVPNVQWKTTVLLGAAMRASCAVPAVFSPKPWEGMCLVDGGVTNYLPVDLLVAAGEPNVLAVDLSADYHFSSCQNIIEIASHSLSVMSRHLSDAMSTGEKLLLRPSLPEEAGLLTFPYMKACMDAGYEAAVAMMPAIKKIFA